jgi:hypothetical protein
MLDGALSPHWEYECRRLPVTEAERAAAGPSGDYGLGCLGAIDHPYYDEDPFMCFGVWPEPTRPTADELPEPDSSSAPGGSTP